MGRAFRAARERGCQTTRGKSRYYSEGHQPSSKVSATPIPEIALQRTRVIHRQEPVTRARIGSLTIQLLRWIVGLAILAWIVRANGGWRIVQLPVEFPWPFVAFTLQVLIGAVIEAQRLRLLVGAAVAHLPFAASYRLVGIATLFNMAIPGGTGGDLLKLVLLAKRIPGKRAELTALLLIDRIIGLTSILLVALLAAGTALATGSAPARLIGIVVTPALLLLGAVIAAIVASTGPSQTMLLRFVPSRWTRLRGLLNRAWDTAHVMRNQPGVLLRALGISLIGQGIMAISFAIASLWLLPGVSPLTAAAIAFIGLIVNAIPITPGGIGVGEAAFEGLFALVGVSGGSRLLLSWRFGQLPFALLGAVYFARHREEMRPVMDDVAEYRRHAEQEHRV
jgi:uncharacterized protein (TIRG00374 family)